MPHCVNVRHLELTVNGRHHKIVPASERLWRHVRKTDPNDCWLWLGAGNGAGYGVIGTDHARHKLVHRVAWEAEHGPIPDGLHIDHLCCTKLCVNVRHMELVTPGENNRRARERNA
jgi:hypothetical protein